LGNLIGADNVFSAILCNGGENPKRPCTQFGWEFYDGFDIVDNDIGSEPAANRNDCQPKCRARGGNFILKGQCRKIFVWIFSPSCDWQVIYIGIRLRVPLTFSFAQLAKGKSLGRSKPATKSQIQALATHCVDCFYYIQALLNCLL